MDIEWNLKSFPQNLNFSDQTYLRLIRELKTIYKNLDLKLIETHRHRILDGTRRNTALSHFSVQNDDIKIFRKMMRNTSPRVREKAVILLSELKGPEVRSLLGTVIRSETSNSVASLAYQQLKLRPLDKTDLYSLGNCIKDDYKYLIYCVKLLDRYTMKKKVLTYLIDGLTKKNSNVRNILCQFLLKKESRISFSTSQLQLLSNIIQESSSSTIIRNVISMIAQEKTLEAYRILGESINNSSSSSINNFILDKLRLMKAEVR